MADADFNSPVLNLSADEKRVYPQLFQQADTERLGVVTGEIAVKFFEKTKLAPIVLGEIWQLADQENRGLLTKGGFCMALRLIGHAQAGKDPTLDLAFKPAPLPRFEGLNLQPPPTSPTVANAPPNALQPQGSGIRIPPILPEKANQYAALFDRSGAQGGQLPGESARLIFERAGLPNEVLGRIWGLADREQKGALDMTEFIIAMHLITSLKARTMTAIPMVLPPGLYEAAQRRGQPAPRPGVPPVVTQGIPRQFTGPQRTSATSPLGRPPHVPPPAQVAQTTGQAWLVSAQEKVKYDQLFDTVDTNKSGLLSGEQAVKFFGNSGLNEEALATIWDLADIRSEGYLNRDEFAVAMFLIRLQRSGSTLPEVLPPALIPPSMRGPIRTSVAPPPPQQPQQSLPLAPQFSGSAQGVTQASRSAADDLFGLDSSPMKAAPVQAVQTTGGSIPGRTPFDTDPFSNNKAALSPQTTGQPSSSVFRPFQPTSAFGATLTTQNTGTGTASPQARGFAPQQPPPPPANDDLLGDGDEEQSKKLTSETTELANLSTQIGNLRNQMQDLQSKKTTNERDVSATNSQKQELQQRLAQFRALYEQEVQAVKTLEQQLATSRTETQKLQQEFAMVQGSHADLQSQHAQLAQALEADRGENTSLKTRIGQLNAEIGQLRPQIEKLKSEARQQKGMVAINKKQLTTNESERDKLSSELTEVTREQEAERMRSSNESPVPRSSVASPAPSTHTNPFFRKASQQSVLPEGVQSPNSFPASAPSPSAFDALFGPAAPSRAISPPSVPFAQAEEQTHAHELPATSAISSSQIERAASPAALEPPAPPPAVQFTPSMLPVHSGGPRTESVTSSTRVMPALSAVPGSTPVPGASRAASRAYEPVAFGENFPELQRPQFTGASASSLSMEVPGSFPADFSATPTAVAQAVPAPSNDDFDAAFAGFKADGDKTGEPQADASKHNEDFYPMTEPAEDSESDDDGHGFDDNFGTPTPKTNGESKGKAPAYQPATEDTARAAPPPAIEDLPVGAPPALEAQKSPPVYSPRENTASDFPDEYHGLLPAREDPTTSPHSVPSEPAFQAIPVASSSSVFSGNTPFDAYTNPSSQPTSATEEVANGAATPTAPKAAPTFDDFDDFGDLSEAKASNADEIFSSDVPDAEYNPTFDSPAASMMTAGMASSQQTPLGNSQTFHDFGSFNASDSISSAFGAARGGSASNSAAQDQGAGGNHDWDAIFSNLGPNSHAATFPSTENGGVTTPKAEQRPEPSRALTTDHDDPILKRLTGMGYSRDKALDALEKYDYDINEAIDHLTRQ